jgi:hypothetical protein
MPVKLLFTIIGFNSLVLIFLAAITVVYFRPQQWGGMLALFLGWLTGFVNIGTSEIQFPVLLLLAFGFFLGHARPNGVWKLALVLGMFVPLSQFAWILAARHYDTVVAEGIGSLMAFVPAFAGTYLGKSIADSHASKQSAVNASVQTSDNLERN